MSILFTVWKVTVITINPFCQDSEVMRKNKTEFANTLKFGEEVTLGKLLY